MSQKTLSQRRSLFALESLGQAKVNDELKTLLQGLPSMVLANGFAQTLAFVIQKGKQSVVVNWTINWLHEQGFVQSQEKQYRAFMTEISVMEQRRYLDCQRETLRLWEWLKRYSGSGMFDKLPKQEGP